MNIQSIELPSQFNKKPTQQQDDLKQDVVELPPLKDTEETITEEFETPEIKEEEPQIEEVPKPQICKPKLFGQINRPTMNTNNSQPPVKKNNNAISYGLPILMGVLLLSKIF